ncbi:MAG: hypothetical protein QXL15_02195 [Candidatus Korarchaeota archaeon]
MSVAVTCPKCRQKLDINVDPAFIENSQFFPVPYGYVHGSPVHVIILYLDRDLKVRGIDVSEYVRIEVHEGKKEIEISDLIKHMGEYAFMQAISALLMGHPVVVENFDLLNEKIQRLIKKIGLDEFIDKNKEPVIYDYISGTFSNMPPIKSKYPVIISKKLASLSEADAEKFLTEQVNFFKKAKKKLDMITKPISFSEARKILELGNDSIEILPYIIIVCNAGEKILRDYEVKIRKSLW